MYLTSWISMSLRQISCSGFAASRARYVSILIETVRMAVSISPSSDTECRVYQLILLVQLGDHQDFAHTAKEWFWQIFQTTWDSWAIESSLSTSRLQILIQKEMKQALCACGFEGSISSLVCEVSFITPCFINNTCKARFLASSVLCLVPIVWLQRWVGQL